MKTKVPRMIPNPEYLKSDERRWEINNFKDALAINRECVEDFFPEDHGKALAEDGGWIMLLASVHVGLETPNGGVTKIDVPHLSIWYAMPTVTNFSRKVGKLEMPMKQAIIQTPHGAVHIWPHEYNVVSDLMKFLEFTEEDGFYIHFLNPTSEGFDPDKLHYIQSRGIPLGEARKMLLPEMKNPYFCYFTFNEAYSEIYPEWTGTPYMIGRGQNRKRAEAAL